MIFVYYLLGKLYQFYTNFEVASNLLTFWRRRSAPPGRPSSTNSKVRHRLNLARHGSAMNLIVNLIAGLLAFTRQTKKLSLHLFNKDFPVLPILI